jgi:hypothetical protein
MPALYVKTVRGSILHLPLDHRFLMWSEFYLAKKAVLGHRYHSSQTFGL